MTNSSLPTILPRNPLKELKDGLTQEAWLNCEGSGDAPSWFRSELGAVLSGYFEKPGKHVSLPAKDRNKFYKNVGQATHALLDAIGDLPDRIEWELQNIYTANEPENVDAILSGDNEGISYGEYELEHLTRALKLFQSTIVEAKSEFTPEGGRPRQNENLEATIAGLAALYKKVTGREAMSGYSYREIDSDRPYQGPFLSFVTTLLWSHNGRQFPTNPTIGEAARKALGLRK